MNVIPASLTYRNDRANSIVREWFAQRGCMIDIGGLSAFLSTFQFVRDAVVVRVGYYIKFRNPEDELWHFEDFLAYRRTLKFSTTGFHAPAPMVDTIDDPIIDKCYPEYGDDLRRQVQMLLPHMRYP